MLDVLQTKYPGYKNKLDDARKHLRFISNLLKQEEDSFFIKEEDRKELLDSLADQIVTATGVGTFLGMNVPEHWLRSIAQTTLSLKMGNLSSMRI